MKPPSQHIWGPFALLIYEIHFIKGKHFMSSNNPLVWDRSKINEAEFLWGAISSAEVRPCDSLGYRIIFQEKIWKPDSRFLCKLEYSRKYTAQHQGWWRLARSVTALISVSWPSICDWTGKEFNTFPFIVKRGLKSRQSPDCSQGIYKKSIGVYLL